MAQILAFAGSNSSSSINFRLVKHTVSLVEGHEVHLLDLAQTPLPMYSEDEERDNGFHPNLVALREAFQRADGVLFSVNEHNSNPSAFFKNTWDWLSRVDRDFIAGKKVFLMSTSGGKRGAIGALGVAEQLLKRFKADVTGTFSLPNFNTSFSDAEGILDQQLAKAHRRELQQFLRALRT
ncbi:NADPH-dependent FMN reductase [Maribacter sp. 2307ULW6-5]|uniref:NADPH-dependent FMN reductase n=1 Tax=Maribacter sp. 2307ULW6-5 TaxID=3386275 RepID=UPI0039BCCF15